MEGVLRRQHLLRQTREPLSFEERLQKAFPGSEWVVSRQDEEGLATPTLEMVCIGNGGGPKNVLATDGVVYPYGRFKHLRGKPIRQTASEPPAVGPTAIAVIGGAKFDEASLVNWLRTLPRDVILVTTAPRLKKDGEPFKGDFGGELLKHAKELDLRVDFVSRREDLYGTYAKRVQLGEVIHASSGDVVLVGRGGDQDSVKAIAQGDWAIAKATLGDRQVVEIG